MPYDYAAVRAVHVCPLRVDIEVENLRTRAKLSLSSTASWLCSLFVIAVLACRERLECVSASRA